MHKKKSCS